MDGTLNQAGADGDVEGMLNVLHCLSTVAMSESILRSCKIGHTVRHLRKSTDSQVAAAASDIIEGWKALINEHKSKSPWAAASTHLSSSLNSLTNQQFRPNQ